MKNIMLSASLIAGSLAGFGAMTAPANAAETASCHDGPRFCGNLIQACYQAGGSMSASNPDHGIPQSYTCTLPEGMVAETITDLTLPASSRPARSTAPSRSSR